MILILHRHRLFSFSLLYKIVVLRGMDKSLLDAIVNGDVSTVTNLLDHGYSVDCCDEEGTNLLHMSAANGDEKMARLLLSRGASLKATNHYGWTALMAAAYYGHQRICTMLIQNKADVNSQNFLGATALDCAARCGHYSVAEILVKAGAEINLQNRFCSGEGVEVSPLMTAAQHGHESVVQLLLRNGAEINYYNEKTRWNSLMLAALNGHTITVEILVDHKADTNFTNILQKNALEIAENRQKKEVIEYLNQRTAFRRKSRGDQCLVKPTIIEAARNGDLESVKDLLDHNASDVLETDKDGATALVYAAMGNHLEVVQLLYEQGADLDVQDKKNGWTALMQATLYGHTKVAKFLIDHGADVNLRGSGGWTAFDVASITGDTEVLRLLASVTMQLPAKPKNNHSFLRWTNMKPSDIKMDREIISLPRDDMDRDFAKNKNWWAKMSNRFRNFNIMRSLRLSSSTKLTVIETSSKMSDAPEPDNVGTTRSLAKVLDTTLKATGREIKRPKTLTVGAPVCKLPDDLIDPILPPPSMSKLTFELTRSPRNAQIDDEEATTSQNSVSGELSRRIASNDRYSYSGSPDSSFSTASSPSNNSGSRTLRPTSPLTPDLSSAFMITKRRKSNSRGVSHSSGVHSDFYSSDIEKPTPKGRRHYKVAPEDTSNAADTMNFSACSLPSNINLDECKDDIGAILNSLCLEQYSSIFEEEEVDMEAFLELNGRDLKGLGVIDRDARHLLLAVIDKLNNGKYREQQRMQDLMATFKATSHR